MRPTCINHGCEKPVAAIRGRHGGTGIHAPRWRIHCSHCQQASYGKHPHRPGVTPYKTGMCSNIDGHLGFECFTNWDNVPDDYKGRTEIDHIDGNSINNDSANLDELCVHCHKYKGQRAGDYNGNRDGKLSKCATKDDEPAASGTVTIVANKEEKIFDKLFA